MNNKLVNYLVSDIYPVEEWITNSKQQHTNIEQLFCFDSWYEKLIICSGEEIMPHSVSMITFSMHIHRKHQQWKRKKKNHIQLNNNYTQHYYVVHIYIYIFAYSNVRCYTNLCTIYNLFAVYKPVFYKSHISGAVHIVYILQISAHIAYGKNKRCTIRSVMSLSAVEIISCVFGSK